MDQIRSSSTRTFIESQLAKRGDPILMGLEETTEPAISPVMITRVRITALESNIPPNGQYDLPPGLTNSWPGIHSVSNITRTRQLGVLSVRYNTGGPRIIPAAEMDPVLGYPMNKQVVPYLQKAIESFKELAAYGERVGIKVIIENHW